MGITNDEKKQQVLNKYQTHEQKWELVQMMKKVKFPKKEIYKKQAQSLSNKNKSSNPEELIAKLQDNPTLQILQSAQVQIKTQP